MTHPGRSGKGESVVNQKSLIRAKTKEALEAMSDQDYIDDSQQIAKQLVSSAFWQASHTVAITISRHREVDTYQIIDQAWKEKKRVAVPRTDLKEKSMQFYELSSFTQLEKRYSDLMEPLPEVCTPVAEDQLDLIIVPGLAFDGSGSRLGFGGGFYDRLLARVEKKSVALAFSCQLYPGLPTEAHDQPVDHVITVDGFIR
nr:5-formyltetrahydrofolate cyclo-ligase [Halalkalibacter oceani]